MARSSRRSSGVVGSSPLRQRHSTTATTTTSTSRRRNGNITNSNNNNNISSTSSSTAASTYPPSPDSRLFSTASSRSTRRSGPPPSLSLNFPGPRIRKRSGSGAGLKSPKVTKLSKSSPSRARSKKKHIPGSPHHLNGPGRTPSVARPGEGSDSESDLLDFENDIRDREYWERYERKCHDEAVAEAAKARAQAWIAGPGRKTAEERAKGKELLRLSQVNVWAPLGRDVTEDPEFDWESLEPGFSLSSSTRPMPPELPKAAFRTLAPREQTHYNPRITNDWYDTYKRGRLTAHEWYPGELVELMLRSPKSRAHATSRIYCQGYIANPITPSSIALLSAGVSPHVPTLADGSVAPKTAAAVAKALASTPSVPTIKRGRSTNNSVSAALSPAAFHRPRHRLIESPPLTPAASISKSRARSKAALTAAASAAAASPSVNALAVSTPKSKKDKAGKDKGTITTPSKLGNNKKSVSSASESAPLSSTPVKGPDVAPPTPQTPSRGGVGMIMKPSLLRFFSQGSWHDEERELFLMLFSAIGREWKVISARMAHIKSPTAIKNFFYENRKSPDVALLIHEDTNHPQIARQKFLPGAESMGPSTPSRSLNREFDALASGTDLSSRLDPALIKAIKVLLSRAPPKRARPRRLPTSGSTSTPKPRPSAPIDPTAAPAGPAPADAPGLVPNSPATSTKASPSVPSISDTAATAQVASSSSNPASALALPNLAPASKSSSTIAGKASSTAIATAAPTSSEPTQAVAAPPAPETTSTTTTSTSPPYVSTVYAHANPVNPIMAYQPGFSVVRVITPETKMPIDVNSVYLMGTAAVVAQHPSPEPLSGARAAFTPGKSPRPSSTASSRSKPARDAPLVPSQPDAAQNSNDEPPADDTVMHIEFQLGELVFALYFPYGPGKVGLWVEAYILDRRVAAAGETEFRIVIVNTRLRASFWINRAQLRRSLAPQTPVYGYTFTNTATQRTTITPPYATHLIVRPDLDSVTPTSSRPDPEVKFYSTTFPDPSDVPAPPIPGLKVPPASYSPFWPPTEVFLAMEGSGWSISMAAYSAGLAKSLVARAQARYAAPPAKTSLKLPGSGPGSTLVSFVQDAPPLPSSSSLYSKDDSGPPPLVTPFVTTQEQVKTENGGVLILPPLMPLTRNGLTAPATNPEILNSLETLTSAAQTAAARAVTREKATTDSATSPARTGKAKPGPITRPSPMEVMPHIDDIPMTRGEAAFAVQVMAVIGALKYGNEEAAWDRCARIHARSGLRTLTHLSNPKMLEVLWRTSMDMQAGSALLDDRDIVEISFLSIFDDTTPSSEVEAEELVKAETAHITRLKESSTNDGIAEVFDTVMMALTYAIGPIANHFRTGGSGRLPTTRYVVPSVDGLLSFHQVANALLIMAYREIRLECRHLLETLCEAEASQFEADLDAATTTTEALAATASYRARLKVFKDRVLLTASERFCILRDTLGAFLASLPKEEGGAVGLPLVRARLQTPVRALPPPTAEAPTAMDVDKATPGTPSSSKKSTRSKPVTFGAVDAASLTLEVGNPQQGYEAVTHAVHKAEERAKATESAGDAPTMTSLLGMKRAPSSSGEVDDPEALSDQETRPQKRARTRR